ncbi:oligosaccharide flippase family protein [Granulosicoccaceae sp. 1_MG-2023]|nr:oligosaccharide flippase family protein [Granulosicoccaceae sp. 1_MG-2023]
MSAFKHLRNYASAGLLSALAGVLSFPVLTRNLSVEDYGLLGLVTASITVAVALGKLGLQHAIIRFFPKAANTRDALSERQLYSTVLTAMAVLAGVLSLLWLLGGVLLIPRVMSSGHATLLFVLGTGVVFFRLFGSAVINFLRARQSSGVVSVSQVLHKYLHLILILIALALGQLSAAAVIGFLFIAEVVMVLYVSRALWPHVQFSAGDFSASLLKTLIAFGLPLMAYESLSLVLRLSDRYIIEALLGVNELGQYSASYNLSSYLELIIISGMIQAVRPMYTTIWENESREATAQFLARGFYLYVVVGVPVIFGFSLLAPDLLVLLSGEKYAPGTVVIPYVAFSFYLEGAVLFLGAGLHIHRDTTVFLRWAAISAVLNIALNFIFVPLFGLVGAAFMTIVSYLVFLAGVTRVSFRSLDFPVAWRQLWLIPLLSLIAYVLLGAFDTDGLFTDLLAKGVLVSLIYAALLLALAAPVRELVFAKLAQFRSGGAA